MMNHFLRDLKYLYKLVIIKVMEQITPKKIIPIFSKGCVPIVKKAIKNTTAKIPESSLISSIISLKNIFSKRFIKAMGV